MKVCMIWLRKELLLPDEHPGCEERNSQAPPTPQGVTQKASWLNRRMLPKATSLDFQISKLCHPRPINPKAKWIKRHKQWAKVHKVGGFLFLVLVCWMLTQTTPSRNWILNVRQVSLKDSMKLFAKRYPKASGQVTSMREMQAWVHQYMNHIDQVNLCGDQL